MSVALIAPYNGWRVVLDLFLEGEERKPDQSVSGRYQAAIASRLAPTGIVGE
ncbi:hypothetical protein [Pseudomonas thivervalensis]|uniref:hypothetical protein n=1 Tax=Pseudomonas thivervalensis TaxID=86265 RepID=UPI000B1EF371|nr:hypothetical protein [Pseudomonas thivervalensis]